MKTVLLVSKKLIDEAQLRNSIGESCAILATDCTEKALELLEANSEVIFAVIISAYLEEDGINYLVNHINGIDVYKRIPILFEVNQSDAFASQKALDEGAYDLIAYPYNPVMIKKQLDKAPL